MSSPDHDLIIKNVRVVPPRQHGARIRHRDPALPRAEALAWHSGP